MKNILKLIAKYFGLVAFFVLLTIAILYIASLFYSYSRSDFIRLNYPPRILNSDTLTPANVFKRGDGLVMEYDITKFEIGCYAEYTHTFTGPVSFQIVTGKSRNIGKRGDFMDFVLKTYMEIPAHVPPGAYKVQIAVFPTCNGIPRDPFVFLDPAPVIWVEK